jgi:hypothetical protein
VNSGGRIEVVGTSANVATVTRSSASTGRYFFTVNGRIAAENYLIEHMEGTNGVYITSSGTIDGTHNFSNGTFANGDTNSPILKIENNQDFTGVSNRIENVQFSDISTGSSSNVEKTSDQGNLEFYNALGALCSTIPDSTYSPGDTIRKSTAYRIFRITD